MAKVAMDTVPADYDYYSGLNNVMSDLLIHGTLACFLLLFSKYAMERLLFLPLGMALGLTEKMQSRNTIVLERAYESLKMRNGVTDLLVGATGLPRARVERWLTRQRKRQTKLTKFRECAFKLCFYTCSCLVGFWALWDTDFLFQPRNEWVGLPSQPVSDKVYVYYVLQVGFFLSSMVWIFQDEIRKDFWCMLLHHLVTLVTQFWAWHVNFIRIGVVSFLMHDTCDPFLELAKISLYVKRKSWLADISFAIFICQWTLMRLVLFPLTQIYSAIFHLPEVLGPELVDAQLYWPHRIMTIFLCIIFCLNLVWTYYIIQVAVKTWGEKKRGDTRESDKDDYTDSDVPENNGKSRGEEEETEHVINKNGVAVNGGVFLQQRK